MQIKEALNEILDSHGIHVKDVAIRAQPAGRDPRTAVHKQLGGGVTNQARLVPSEALPGYSSEIRPRCRPGTRWLSP